MQLARMRGGAGYGLLVLLCLPLLLYLVVLGVSRVYVSDDITHRHMSTILVEPTPEHPIATRIEQLGLPGLNDMGPVRVPRVEVEHAFRNVAFVLCAGFLFGLLPILILLFGIGVLVYGLVSGDWEKFGLGALIAFIAAPVSVIAVVFGIIGIWGLLLLQPCSPGYAVLWTIVGLPIMALGFCGGASSSMSVIVIIKR